MVRGGDSSRSFAARVAALVLVALAIAAPLVATAHLSAHACVASSPGGARIAVDHDRCAIAAGEDDAIAPALPVAAVTRVAAPERRIVPPTAPAPRSIPPLSVAPKTSPPG